MSELKPCPFCGGKAELREERVNGYTKYFISCENDNCNVVVETMSRVGNTAAQAVEAWESRVKENDHE